MTLRIDAISAAYGQAQVLFDLSLEARPGEILCLVGRNGAGKTSTLKTIMGLLPLQSGQIALDGTRLDKLPPHQIPRHGIGYVPQGRRLFTELTVAENIDVGLNVRSVSPDTRERVLSLFPRLRERLKQRAGTLSGGEQQMLATARALSLEPNVLMLDEPTEGLQPSMIELIREVVVRMRDAGVAIVLVEQRIDAVLSIADQVAFIEHGKTMEVVAAHSLTRDDERIHRYLGV